MRKQFTIFLILVFVLGLVPVNFSMATNLASRLKGKILLQVESRGEAWYVHPDSEKRYYLGRPADAFSVMRELGLGVSNKDFDAWNGKAPSRLSGKILLKVEDSGKAYYVNPVDLKMHYLGRPADAFRVMRNLGLGIANDNLGNIDISGESSLPTDKTSILIPISTPTPTPINNVTSRYYKNQVIDILTKVKNNYISLADYANECASLASDRKIQLQSMASNRNSFLAMVAFDDLLYRLFTLQYDLYDGESKIMEENRYKCDVTYLNKLNNNIDIINSHISDFLISDYNFTADTAKSWHDAYFIDHKFSDDRASIKAVIDKISYWINNQNQIYLTTFNSVQAYIDRATAPSVQSTQYNSYIPPAPALPPMPKTTHCTFGTIGGGGVESVLNCYTF